MYLISLWRWKYQQCNQRAEKVMSDSPGLVDFAIGLVNFVLNSPDRQIKFTYRKTLISPVHQNDSWAGTCQLQLARMTSCKTGLLCTLYNGYFWWAFLTFLILKNNVFGKYQVHIAVEGACMAPPSVNPFPELLIFLMSWCMTLFSVFSFNSLWKVVN